MIKYLLSGPVLSPSSGHTWGNSSTHIEVTTLIAGKMSRGSLPLNWLYMTANFADRHIKEGVKP